MIDFLIAGVVALAVGMIVYFVLVRIWVAWEIAKAQDVDTD